MREIVYRNMFFLGILWVGFAGFILAADTVIVGELIDSETLVGISGEINLSSNEKGVLVTRHAKSDEVGRVEFQQVSEGKWQLTTKVLGYASEHAIIDVVEGETHRVHLYLKKGGRLIGRITDSEGKPIVNAQVSVRYAHDSGRSPVFAIHQWESGDVVTDLQGEYEIRDVHPDKEFVVEASHEDFLPSVSTPMTRAPTDNAAVDLSLYEGLPMTGTIQDDDGTPIAGAIVGLLGTIPEEARSFLAIEVLHANRRFTVSNEAGEFQFDPVRPGEKLILVSHSSYRDQQQFVDLPKEGQISPTVVILSP